MNDVKYKIKKHKTCNETQKKKINKKKVADEEEKLSKDKKKWKMENYEKF